MPASHLNNRITSLEGFSKALDFYPAAFMGNPLHLLFVEDATPISVAEGAAKNHRRAWDRSALTEERREFLLASSAEVLPWAFPAFEPRSRPQAAAVSDALFDRFETAARFLPLQREIGKSLAAEVQQSQPDVVALMVVDGLSYYDLPDDPAITPCLVDGVSITPFGYREVIGRPNISQRLFALGYREQQGFTFFDPETNPLAGDLYALFSRSEVHTIRRFEEGLETLRKTPLSRAFVQITATGLDHLCHQHRDRPPREEYLKRILYDFDRLVDCLTAPRYKGGPERSVLAYLTSDHGILWREELPEETGTVVKDLSPDDSHRPRYIPGARLRHYGKTVSRYGETNTLLKAPYLTRALQRTEWGVHGGISAWESLVPVVRRAT